MPRRGTSELLGDAIRKYLDYRSTRVKETTLTNDRLVLERFLRLTGDILVHNITEDHIWHHMHESRKTRPKSMRLDHATLSGFLKRYRMENSIRDVPVPGRPEVEMPRLPVKDFPRLLGATEHPRDRMVISLGLELFLRQGEMTALRIADCNLDTGEMRVSVLKKRKVKIDLMPISQTLDEELRSYLKYYTEQCGNLDPAWYLVPAKQRPNVGTWDGKAFTSVRPDDRLKPDRKLIKPERLVQTVLEAIGFPTRDPITHASLGQGIHTLRRSGARALFDQMWEVGWVRPDGTIERVPDPLGVVSDMLHHETRGQTEEYIGAKETKLHRNKYVSQRRSYDSKPDNVVELHRGEKRAGAVEL